MFDAIQAYNQSIRLRLQNSQNKNQEEKPSDSHVVTKVLIWGTHYQSETVTHPSNIGRIYRM